MATPTKSNLEEIRTEANIILKVVDQYIKAGLLDEAKGHLDKARIIDPTNAYIYAFQERIAFLKENESKKNAAASNREAMEAAARAKMEEDRRQAEMDRLKKEAEHLRQLEEWRQKKTDAEKRHEEGQVTASQSNVVPTPAPSPTIADRAPSPSASKQQSIENVEQPKPAPPPAPKRASKPVPAPAPVSNPAPAPAPTVQSVLADKTAEQAHDMYKRVLMLALADGAVSPEEESQLRDLRTQLRITSEEHVKLEQTAKEESYGHAFTLVWTSGMNAKERSAVINELRNKYQISAEAHSKIEARVLVEFGDHQDKPLLYVIDDEEDTLGMIVRVLEGGGFAVKAFNTSDEALAGLKEDMPDLIISDINLETSTIGGFSFYEKVRQLHHLSLVPFIFLSGMTDEGMLRYGKGLGVDDYITKPFSGDMLIDTIKGKLKRYKQIKHN